MQTLSDKIQQCTHGAVANPFQGTDKKVLFVCSMGILRSATAARMYAHKYNTRSAGTLSAALIQVSYTLLEWADEIVFVNRQNADALFGKPRFAKILSRKKVIVLDIPDVYEHMDQALIDHFEQQYEVMR